MLREEEDQQTSGEYKDRGDGISKIVYKDRPHVHIVAVAVSSMRMSVIVMMIMRVLVSVMVVMMFAVGVIVIVFVSVAMLVLLLVLLLILRMRVSVVMIVMVVVMVVIVGVRMAVRFFSVESDDVLVAVDANVRVLRSRFNVEFVAFVVGMGVSMSSSEVEDDRSDKVDHDTASSNTQEVVVHINGFRMDETGDGFKDNVEAESQK